MEKEVWLFLRHDVLALFVTLQGRYADAESLFAWCQAIQEKVVGLEHPASASTLHNRAVLYRAQVRADLDGWLWCVDVFTGLFGV